MNCALNSKIRPWEGFTNDVFPKANSDGLVKSILELRFNCEIQLFFLGGNFDMEML